MIPRSEYPRPQMVRDSYICLNGLWEFEIDASDSALEKGILEKEKLDSEILVPFCPESALSGVCCKDFMKAVWYRKFFAKDKGFEGKRVLLHFEAVDYESTVYLNGEVLGKHRGGYTPFTFDITDRMQENNCLVLKAFDDIRSGRQYAGKQCREYHSKGCDYTRTTGIWQSVWLEAVPQTYLERYEVRPDIDNCKADFTLYFGGMLCKKEVTVKAFYQGEEVGCETLRCSVGRMDLSLRLSQLHLWEVGCGRLYDFEITVDTEEGTDVVKGYFGMRSITLAKDCILINGKKIFQRLILDQGFYEDGIYTAKDDETLKRDIELSMALGFNGARMHQKVFERRYLYHADSMGYLLWGEYASWQMDVFREDFDTVLIPQRLESVRRDINSPSLIGWCPLNETWDMEGKKQCDEAIRNIYLVTKTADPTRPVIDTSGNYHVQTDIFDVHDYEQDVDKFSDKFAPMKNGGEYYTTFPDRQKYEEQPYFVSEYGGIGWNAKSGWGYGNAPKNEEEFVRRYTGLAEVILSNPKIFALCYTQLTDVEQEKNGLYYYNRKPKFSKEVMEKLRAAMAAKAAIEE